MATKKITIYIFYDKRGNSYAMRTENDCLEIICRKLGLSLNPKMDNDYVKKIMQIQSIEKQVNEQYDWEKRKIQFIINY